jgi:hypothetical protein
MAFGQSENGEDGTKRPWTGRGSRQQKRPDSSGRDCGREVDAAVLKR